jgi:hypothetical protein
MESFYHWLQYQIEREDVVGDFACTVRQFEEPVPNRKKMSGHMMWATWLIDKRATADVIEAFNLAWREYQTVAEPLA